jgi:hypothetical protein
MPRIHVLGSFFFIAVQISWRSHTLGVSNGHDAAETDFAK